MSASIKKQEEKKNTLDTLGCRKRFSDKLIAEGYTFGLPQKKGENVHTVSTIWNGDTNNSSDTPSRGVVSVDVKEQKIVKFDCSEQEMIEKEKNINAEVEASKR